MFRTLHDWWTTLKNRWTTRNDWHTEPNEVRILHSDAISVVDSEGVSRWVVDLDSVEEVVTYKWDLYAIDSIHIGLRVRGLDGYYEFWEEMQGWWEATEFLDQHFGFKNREWRRDVTLPPFETCWAVLWSRDQHSRA